MLSGEYGGGRPALQDRPIVDVDGAPRAPQSSAMPSPSPAPLNPDLIDTATPPIPEAQGWARAYDGRRGPLIDLSQAAARQLDMLRAGVAQVRVESLDD